MKEIRGFNFEARPISHVHRILLMPFVGALAGAVLRPILVAVLMAVACGPSLAAAVKEQPPLAQRFMARLHSKQTFIVFDWDENIFKLPTSSVLFLKGEFKTEANPRLFLITSSELSQFKSEVGRSGTPLERFEIIGDTVDPMNGTFRYARPGGNRNYMLEDMRAVVFRNDQLLEKVPREAKAPFFDLFVWREARTETRAADRILTGRGQTPQEFYDAVSLLAKVPEVRATGFEPMAMDRLTLVGGKGPTAKLKSIDLVERLREASEKGYTLFVFPDDDAANVRRAAETLAKVERSIDVWIIWTRENGDSRLIDLAEVEAIASRDRTEAIASRDPAEAAASTTRFEAVLASYLDQKLDPERRAGPNVPSHQERERASLYCRALFF